MIFTNPNAKTNKPGGYRLHPKKMMPVPVYLIWVKIVNNSKKLNIETLPPGDLAAEVCLLGSLIIGDKHIPDIIKLIRTSDFYQAAHRHIFEGIIELYNDEIGVDLKTLESQLSKNGFLEESGGIDYLISLPESVPSAANAVHYANIIREKSIRRQAIQAYTEAIKKAYDKTEPINRIADGLESYITDIRRSLNGSASQITMVNLSTIKRQPVEWLWLNRFAVGKLNLIVGDPDLGKSFITLDMTARITSGNNWPDNPHLTLPGDVILLSAEDDVADTIKPRIEDMGGDCSRVHLIQMVKITKDKGRMFDLGTDIHQLSKAIDSVPGCRMIVIDPVSAYLGGVDGHSNAEVRGLLSPLSELAGRHRVAVVCVTHLNKGGSTNPLYRMMGSLAFSAAARVVWMVTSDRDDPKRRLMLPAKCNISPSQDGLAYRLIDGRVVWDELLIKQTASGYFSMEEVGRKSPMKQAAKQWLLDILFDGPMWAADITEQAKLEGYNHNTIQAAKRDGGVISERVGFGKNAKCYWRLEGQNKQLPED